MYDTILVPVDGSDPSRAAVRRARSLAATADATLSLLAVAEPTTLRDGAKSPATPTRADLDRQTDAVLDRGESLADGVGVDCRVAVEAGSPYEEIAAKADEVDADLTVMGTHGRTGLDRILLGSVTERTLRTNESPVLTTQEGQQPWTVDDILVPTNGSDPATEAVTHALDLATVWDATVHALGVVDTETLASTYDAGAVIPTVVETLRKDAEADVETVRDGADERGLNCETTVLEGDPGRAIVEYADEHADLVAMGTHGRAGLHRLLLGSVTEHVVRRCPVPLLAVPTVTE